MNASTIVKIAILAAAGVSLTACGGGGGGGGGAAVASAPATVPSIESQAGPNFNADFFAPSTATPADPMPGDIIPLTLTGAPFQLH